MSDIAERVATNLNELSEQFNELVIESAKLEQEVEQLRQELDTLKKCKQERDELQKRISQYKLDCLYVTKELEAIKQDHINTALDLADTQRERDSLAVYVERLQWLIAELEEHEGAEGWSVYLREALDKAAKEAPSNVTD